MSHRFTAFRAVLAGSTILAAAALGVAAPAPAAAQGGANAEEADGQLDTIMVTANRRSENLQKVAVSADILDQERVGAIFSATADITALAGTVSEAAKNARDTMLGLLKTCSKLGVSCYRFLGDRFAVARVSTIDSLPSLVRLAAP